MAVCHKSCFDERRHEKVRGVERMCVFYFRLLCFLVTSSPLLKNLCWAGRDVQVRIISSLYIFFFLFNDPCEFLFGCFFLTQCCYSYSLVHLHDILKLAKCYRFINRCVNCLTLLFGAQTFPGIFDRHNHYETPFIRILERVTTAVWTDLKVFIISRQIPRQARSS